MPGVSADQVKQAKKVDLLSYLQANEPQELRPSAPGEYRTVSHGSLVISNGMWIWNRGGVGGRTALDYLIKVRGMGFVDAVKTVLGSRAAPAFLPLPVKSTETAVSKTLYLPQSVSIPSNAVRYLQQRGIHFDVISRCLKSNILYEGRYKNTKEPELDNTPVCVFVGCDDNGKRRFAAIRGIGTDLKRDAAGSDKKYGFTLPAKYPISRALAVFESPIDLLSHATLEMRGDTDFEGHRLSLGGTSDVALMAYLERNPQTAYISFCLDSDDAGRIAAKRMFETFKRDERYCNMTMSIDWPEGAKDYNEELLQTLNLERRQKQPNRREADILL